MGSNPVGVTKTNGNTKSVAVFLSLPGFEPIGSVAFDGLTLTGKVRDGIFSLKSLVAYPVGVTKQVKGEPVSIRRRIRFYHIFQKLKIKKKQSTLCIRECFVFLYAKR